MPTLTRELCVLDTKNCQGSGLLSFVRNKLGAVWLVTQSQIGYHRLVDTGHRYSLLVRAFVTVG